MNINCADDRFRLKNLHQVSIRTTSKHKRTLDYKIRICDHIYNNYEFYINTNYCNIIKKWDNKP